MALDPAPHRLYVAMTTLNQVDVYSTKAPYKLLGIIKQRRRPRFGVSRRLPQGAERHVRGNG